MSTSTGRASFGEIYLVSDKLQTIPRSEVEAAEARLGVKLPPDYAAYMEELGVGALCGDVRVWPPDRVVGELEEVRRRWAEFYHWDQAALTPATLAECILLADTTDGDELVYHPERGTFYCLPRHSEKVITLGSTLWEAVDWALHSGKVLGRKAKVSYFVPFTAREKLPVEVPAPLRDVVAFLETALPPDHVIEKTRESYLALVKAIGGEILALADGSSAARAWITHDPAGEELAWQVALAMAELRARPAKGTAKGLPPEMLRGQNVEWLKLLQAGVTDETLAQLGEMKNLSEIYLPGCKNITDGGLSSLAGLKRVTKLNLSGSAVTDAGIANLGGMEKVQQADLSGTGITDAALAHLARWPALAFLNLANTVVGDAGMESLADCGKLNHLTLDRTQVTDAGIATLASCPNLTFLGVTGTAISDAIVPHLERFPKLQRLVCKETGITAEGVEAVRKLRPRLAVDRGD